MQRRTSLQVNQQNLAALRRNKKSITEIYNNFGPAMTSECDAVMPDEMEDERIQEVLVLSHDLTKKVSLQDSHSTITSEKSPEQLLARTAISLRKKETQISAQTQMESEIISEKEVCFGERQEFGQNILNLQHFRHSLARIITEQQ